MTFSANDIRQLEQHGAEAWEAFMAPGSGLGTTVHHVADAVAFRWTDVPEVLWNRVVCLGNDRLPSNDDIDQILSLYREHNLPCIIQLSPLADVAAISTMLRAHGLEQETSWAVMALRHDGWTNPSLNEAVSLEPLTDANFDAWMQVFLETFGLAPPVDRMMIESLRNPDVYGFLARYDGEPAGTGELIIKAGVGGLYSGATAERFRRRGLHTALIALRVKDAFDRGLELCFSETEEVGDQSERDLARQGFQRAYDHITWYLAPPQAE